jgi:hypothetical protein
MVIFRSRIGAAPPRHLFQDLLSALVVYRLPLLDIEMKNSRSRTFHDLISFICAIVSGTKCGLSRSLPMRTLMPSSTRPYQADYPSRNAKSSDPKTWGTWHDAMKSVLAGHADGVGYVLTDSSIGAIDLDHCYDPETGAIAPWAQAILDREHAAYTEVTVSGTGLRMIGTSCGGKPGRSFEISGASDGEKVEVFGGASARFIS